MGMNRRFGAPPAILDLSLIKLNEALGNAGLRSRCGPKWDAPARVPKRTKGARDKMPAGL